MRNDCKRRTLELTNAVMTPSTVETSSSATIPVTENVLHLDVQETPTTTTDATREVQHDSFILSALQNGFSTTATDMLYAVHDADTVIPNHRISQSRIFAKADANQ